MSNFILSLNYSVRIISLKDHEAILYVIVSRWNFQRAPMIPPFFITTHVHFHKHDNGCLCYFEKGLSPSSYCFLKIPT